MLLTLKAWRQKLMFVLLSKTFINHWYLINLSIQKVLGWDNGNILFYFVYIQYKTSYLGSSRNSNIFPVPFCEQRDGTIMSNILYRFLKPKRNRTIIPVRCETGKQKTHIVEAYLKIQISTESIFYLLGKSFESM